MATATQVNDACEQIDRRLANFRADAGRVADMKWCLEKLAWLREQYRLAPAAFASHVDRIKNLSQQVHEVLAAAREALTARYLEAVGAVAAWEAIREACRDALLELANEKNLQRLDSPRGWVINFIAKGTIEEGMLGLLKFKKSMFAGVLDGGKNEVFLGGTRLKQFMDSVEKTTTSLPSSMPDENGDNNGRQGSPVASSASASTLQAALFAASPAAMTNGPKEQFAAPPQSLGDLLTAGTAFLHELGQSLRQNQTAESSGETNAFAHLIGRDDVTGKSYLKLPLPQGVDTPQTLTNLLQTVLNALR